jgi:hypothetical protein
MSGLIPPAPAASAAMEGDSPAPSIARSRSDVVEGWVDSDGHLVLPPDLNGAPVRVLDSLGQLVWASFSSGRRKDGVLLPMGRGVHLRVQVRTMEGWVDCRLLMP